MAPNPPSLHALLKSYLPAISLPHGAVVGVAGTESACEYPRRWLVRLPKRVPTAPEPAPMPIVGLYTPLAPNGKPIEGDRLRLLIVAVPDPRNPGGTVQKILLRNGSLAHPHRLTPDARTRGLREHAWDVVAGRHLAGEVITPGTQAVIVPHPALDGGAIPVHANGRQVGTRPPYRLEQRYLEYYHATASDKNEAANNLGTRTRAGKSAGVQRLRRD